MELELKVCVDGRHFSGGAVITVSEPLVEAFKPIDVCDSAMAATAVGGVTEGMAERVVKLREDAAQILSQGIVKLLLAEMKKADTTNGYANN